MVMDEQKIADLEVRVSRLEEQLHELAAVVAADVLAEIAAAVKEIAQDLGPEDEDMYTGETAAARVEGADAGS
jgi:hypothetical protein